MFDKIVNKELLELSEFLNNEANIKLAIVFGSMAQNKATPSSDIDIAIKMSHYMLPHEKLELLSLLTVISSRTVDLIDLSTVGEPLLNQIIKYGTLLKGNKTDIALLGLKNIYANEDFTPYIERSLKQRHERWIK